MTQALLIGGLPRQYEQLCRRLKGRVKLAHLGQGRKSVPAGFAVYFIWARFCAHCQQDAARLRGRVVVHRGGLAALAGRILREAG